MNDETDVHDRPDNVRGGAAEGGMNVAPINMCHGNREWHREVIQRAWRLNEEKGYAVAVMMDT